ncbi:MAG: hypothetical protein AABY37_04635 [Actinomycetota bacterium]
MAKDLFSALKVYLTKVTDGERSPKEIVSEVSTWVRESGESVKSKIEEEVEKSVSKMGFVKREEVDRLKSELDHLRTVISSEEEKIVKKVRSKSATAKKTAKKAVKKVVKK